MEKATEKAIKAGYLKEGHPEIITQYGEFKRIETWAGDNEFSKYEILLDPEFWQALGKAEGWGREFNVSSCGILEDGSFDLIYEDDFSVPKVIPEWKYRWHRFIDHIAEGKSVDNFFKELLTK